MNKATWKRRLLSPGWLMFFSALLCVVLVPVVQAALEHSSEKSERYRQLTEMTESERLKIQHSFKEFQKLSPAEQKSYRELDRRLDQEDLRLKDTLANYQEFLSTLSPVDRAKIDQAATQRERLMLIDRIQEERANLRQQLMMGMTELEEFRANFVRFDVLSSSEMGSISEIIEAHLPVAAKGKVDLKMYTGTPRFIASIAAAYHAWGPPGSNREVFEGNLLNEIESAIQNKKIREALAESDNDQERSRKLRFFLYATIYRIRSNAYPDAAELAKFMERQDSEEQERLYSMPPRIMYSELGKMYLEQSKHPVTQAMKEFPDGRDPFDWRRRSNRGRGRGGPNGRRDDDRDDDDRSRFNRNDDRRARGFRDGGAAEQPESESGSD